MLKPFRGSPVLKSVVASLHDDSGWADVAEVDALLKELHPDFGPRAFGFRNLLGLLRHLGCFDVDVGATGGAKGATSTEPEGIAAEDTQA